MLREDVASRSVELVAGEATRASDELSLSLSTWLESLQNLLPAARCHAVLLADETGVMSVAAVRPAGASFEHVRAVVNEALQGRQTCMRSVPGPGGQGATPETAIVHPVTVRGLVLGAAISLTPVTEPSALATASSITRWGVGWLVSLLLERQLQPLDDSLRRTRALHDLLLTTLVASDFNEAALAAVSALSRMFGASQVQLGWVRKHAANVVARSNAAWIESASNQLNLAAQAMNEAYDRDQTVLWVDAAGPAHTALVAAHRAYGRAVDTAALMSLPLRHQSRVVAVLLCERGTAFTPSEVELAEAAALLLAPAMVRQFQASASLVSHAGRSVDRALRGITDSSHAAWKLGAALAGIALLLSAVVPIGYRVTAPADVEGEVQRSIAAPFQGFIREAFVRAGDSVREGQLLVTLDDKDLQLERVRWQADLEVAEKKAREAMAASNRVDLAQASAQAGQARAQLDLTLERLARVQVVAPFNGVVVRGDLSQQLGSPVEQGKVLFELAPLASWRLMINVDERDIANVAVGQKGDLRLSSMPGASVAFTVRRVTSVAVAKDGRNYFRVEADVGDAAARLRPGMEGLAKVDAGTRSALWVWTHRFVDWVRLQVWEWSP